MTLRLHDYAASGNCYKVRLLLAQLGRDYERVPVDIFAGDTLTEEFGRLNPVRETPVLEGDGADPLPESNAILMHLAEGSDFLAADRAGRSQTLRWLFWEQSEVIPALAGLRFRLMTGRLAPDAPEIERRRAGGHGVLSILDDHLREREFIVGGRYSVADISLYAYLSVAHEAGFDLREHRAIGDWLERVEGTHGFMNDFEPYPPNSQVGQSRSIYDCAI
jgi:glutathione S-transferase